MRIVSAMLAVLVLCPAARSAGPAPASLETVGLSQVRASAAAAARVEGAPQDRIVQSHLLPDGGNGGLIGYANSEAEFEQASAVWKGHLSNAGLLPGRAKLDNGTYFLPYSSPDGSVVRRFLADPKQFKPKDEASLRENRDLILSALAKRGLKVVASYVVALDGMIPTYAVYYATKAVPAQAHEARLRLLKRGEDIDFDILESAGVEIVQKPNSWMAVYLGPELGFVSMLAKDRPAAEKRLAERARYLTSHGKKMIGSRIHEVPPSTSPEYRFLVNMYFYQ